ncbi:NifB/NifX family molybdenum-iron cluster-binding protein [Syntrophotalea acetylenivorans]|uniref:NifB/NifX family molybdenum-iron cluster-binding protein n=1 Tax=Syntrophotalea acetylenivorans TaxID=1842532 RepID=UPI003AAAA154
MPRFGLARQFYLLTVDHHKAPIGPPVNTRWDPRQEPSVARWLKQMNASGVICDGIHPRFQTALKAEGLWVLSGVWGEISDVIECWIKGQLTAENNSDSLNLATCCRPNRNYCHDRNCTKTSTRRNPT